MTELVTTEQAERVIAIIAIALPIAGLTLGAIVGAVRRELARNALLGLVCGLAGPAIWVMWRICNGIIGRFGLDSVKGLLINLALFVAAGLVIGLVVGIVWRRQRPVGVGGTAAPAAGLKDAKR
jgi:hypothetical protein